MDKATYIYIQRRRTSIFWSSKQGVATHLNWYEAEQTEKSTIQIYQRSELYGKQLPPKLETNGGYRESQLTRAESHQ